MSDKKAIKTIDPMFGVLETFRAISEGMVSGGEPEFRKDVFRDEIEGTIIDTVKAFDTRTWETGICREGTWIIVEQYKNRNEAKKGHDVWVEKVKQKPDLDLEDIGVWDMEA